MRWGREYTTFCTVFGKMLCLACVYVNRYGCGVKSLEKRQFLSDTTPLESQKG